MSNTPSATEIEALAKRFMRPIEDQWRSPLSIDELTSFAALVAAKERERITAQLVFIGDGYGVRDKGLSEKTYSLMQQTAYEHAAVVLTNGKQWSVLSPEELSSIRANGITQN